MGVKAAHLLPVVALAILYVGQVAWKSDKWAAQKQRFWTSLRGAASDPVLIWQAVGMLAALVIVGLMVARSGNDSGVGVSSVELRFRSILDKVLYVRPRTKEIFIGYPALLAGIAFALRGRRQWAAPLVVVGSVGLISALNTFCHIHTPIATQPDTCLQRGGGWDTGGSGLLLADTALTGQGVDGKPASA